MMGEGATLGTTPTRGGIVPKGKTGRARVVLAVIGLAAAIGLFAAALFYAGGIDYVSELLAGISGPASGANSAGSPPSVEATLPPGVDQELAQRMYVEQIESGESLRLLSEGKFASFRVLEVTTEQDLADVAVNAKLVDGTSAPGIMRFVKRGGKWYFFAISGLRAGPTGGLADKVAASAALEASENVASELSEAGITAIDQDVLETVLSQQVANQDIVTGIVDGTFSAIAIGKPVRGAGTVSLPVRLTGGDSAPVKGKAILVFKTIDGESRTFLTTFSRS